MITAVSGAARVQWQITRRNVMDYYWLLLIPFYALIFMSVFLASGRTDLLANALIGPLLMAIGQMGFYAASELVANERGHQTLELTIAAPSPMLAVLATRLTVIASTGLLGFIEAWLVARLVFGVSIAVYHPGLLIAALLATMFASICTSILTSVAFALQPGRVRALQNAFTTPIYLLAGVVVPVSFLPVWVQPISRLIFFSWSADLLRDALHPDSVADPLPRLGAVVALGLLGLGAGAFVLRRMLDNLRRDGRFGV